MDCPRCGSSQTKVVHVDKFITVNVRTRKCLNDVCACIFLTQETLQESLADGRPSLKVAEQ